MATAAQCFYCFECLAGSFNNRGAPSLSRIEDLWVEFQAALATGDEKEADGERQGERPVKTGVVLDDTEDTTDDEDEEEANDIEGNPHDESEHAKDVVEQPAHRVSSSLPQPPSQPKLPSISRLQAASSSSPSSSSSTTPSTLSANSSNTALATPASSTTSIPNPSSSPSSAANNRPTYSSHLSQTASYPVFVTWNTISRSTGHKSLRGCIGTFDPLPLATGLQTYALTSAFEDTRFSPIPASLLPSLSCNITLLADFETCADPLDWTLGTHGLKITFIARGRRYGATFLPDVAVEQGWSKEETLNSLMRKSGWDGAGSGAGVGVGAGAVARRFLRGGRDRADEGGGAQKPWEEVSNFTTVRYTGLKAGATYGEWREWRNWVEEWRSGNPRSN